MMWENGKYRAITKEDTASSWALAFLMAVIVVAPIWLLWKLIQAIFFNKKTKKNK